MKITDRNGNDISAAQVGDALSLRFEFVDKNTPYQMFIRELVAVDGVDSAEIMLIDGHGCPTDSSIMSNIIQKDGDAVHLEAPFDVSMRIMTGILRGFARKTAAFLTRTLFSSSGLQIPQLRDRCGEYFVV